MRGIDNPIGVKVGPSMGPGVLVPLIETVCPNIREQPGKVTIITRFGYDKVEAMLPPFIKEIQEARH
jgi:3-deoxy-7-phosphoheptulonate synthase